MMARAGAETVLCTAADAGFFPLLEDMLRSVRSVPEGAGLTLGVLDIGLDPGQRDWLRAAGAMLVEPGWDVAIPWQRDVPGHYRSVSARPWLPRYFPGFEIYLWIDADAWVQDGSAIDLLVGTAASGKLAVVPELDRSYWTSFKAPKLWGQNQKAFAWAFGPLAGHKLGRNPILNGGIFALRGDAPHWAAWGDAYRHAIERPRWFGRSARNFYFQLSEQTALNYVAFGLRLPTALLPATANWFCGKGTPAWDAERGKLVEPNPPHAPLGIVHLAGKGMKDRVWDLPVVQGGTRQTRLRWSDLQPAPEALPVADAG